jgi:hypothetical protein
MADDKSPLPAPASARQPPLDRQALERVLARAAELQGASAMPDSGDLISEAQLLEIGNEVGLAPAVLNQALAEERTRINVPEERGLVAQIAGAGFATATRTVPGSSREILAKIDAWMQREECLQVQRRFADRVTWEPQRGLFGKLRRTVNVSGRGFYLMDAGQVSATVLPVDSSRVVVRLDADINASRARRVGAGGFVGAMGSRPAESSVSAWSSPIFRSSSRRARRCCHSPAARSLLTRSPALIARCCPAFSSRSSRFSIGWSTASSSRRPG